MKICNKKSIVIINIFRFIKLSCFITLLCFVSQIPLACIFFRFVLLAVHTPAFMMWQEAHSVVSISLWFCLAFALIAVSKIALSHMLTSIINGKYTQDVADSEVDGLDKDVVDRLSNIEKYTILRTDSSIFSIPNKTN